MYKNKNWLSQKYEKEGLTKIQIAKLCGVSRVTIRIWVDHFNLKRKILPYKDKCWLENEYVNKRISQKQIAKNLKVDKGTINRWIKIFRLKRVRVTDEYNSYYHKRKQEYLNILGAKCSNCGYNKCYAALDFHHLDKNKKIFEISTGIKNKFSEKDIINEVKKCIILCSNCHRELHVKFITI